MNARSAVAIVVLLACAQRVVAQAPPILLVDTQGRGVDPVVARFVDRALSQQSAALGYAPLAAGAGMRALQAQQLAYPPSMADLWRVLQQGAAPHAVFALVWAENGRYVVQVRVACRDGSGPFYAQGDAGSADLEAVTAALLSKALPPAAPAPTPDRAAAAAAVEPTATPASNAPAAAEPAAAAAAVPAAPLRVRIALREELAVGLARDAFINDVIGARADLALNDTLWLGAHLGYANLAGRAGRAHSVLPYAQLEQRIVLGSGARPLALPLRLALGYLVRNGGFLRLSSGLAVPLGRRSELVFDLLAPTFWSTPDAVLFALDFAVELNVSPE